MSESELPAKTHKGLHAGGESKVMAAEFRFGGLHILNAIGDCGNLSLHIAREHVGHGESQFNTYEKAFVDIEIQSGEDSEVETGSFDIVTIFTKMLVCVLIIVTLGMLLRTGKVMGQTEFSSGIKVKALIVVEMALIADIQLEVSMVAGRIVAGVFGVRHIFLIFAIDAEIKEQSVVVRN